MGNIVGRKIDKKMGPMEASPSKQLTVGREGGRERQPRLEPRMLLGSSVKSIIASPRTAAAEAHCAYSNTQLRERRLIGLGGCN